MQPYPVEHNLTLLRYLESDEVKLTNAAYAPEWINRYDGEDRADMLEFSSSTLVITLQSLSQNVLKCVANDFDESCLVSFVRAPAAIIACPLMKVTHFAAPGANITLPTTSVTDVLDVGKELDIVARLKSPDDHTVVAAYATADDAKTLRNRNVRVIVGKTVRLIDSKRLTRSEHGQIMGFTGNERGVLRTYAINAIPSVTALHMFPVLHVDGETVVFVNGTQGDVETTKQHYRSIFNKT